MSLTDSTGSPFDGTVSVLWGCELSGSSSSHTFRMAGDWYSEHHLVLHTISAGENARDEFHVVEAVTEDEDGASRAPVTLAVLKPSVLPMVTVARLKLAPPVTFRLRAGHGPVYLSGERVSVTELASEEEEEEEEEEETPEKPPKGSSTRKGAAAKKRKVEKEERSSPAPEDPLPAKGRGAGRGRKAAPKK